MKTSEVMRESGVSIVDVAHSPDSDDLFMFWALKNRLIETPLAYRFNALHTQALNEAARMQAFTVVAVSAAVYPQIAADYLILPHGASIGRNYGPVLVSKTQKQVVDLSRSRIGIPGEDTTAARLIRMILPEATFVSYPIVPFEAVFEALDMDEIDAAVLIHEGQLSYMERGLSAVVNIGQWWQEKFGLPLPLGINVVRRDIGLKSISQISDDISASIHYCLDKQEEIASVIMSDAGTSDIHLGSKEDLLTYLSMYANEDTRSMSSECLMGLAALLHPFNLGSQHMA